MALLLTCSPSATVPSFYVLSSLMNSRIIMVFSPTGTKLQALNIVPSKV